MKKLLIIACALLLAGIGAVAYADDMVVKDTGDAFVNAGTGTSGSFADTNYGGKTYEYVENDGATYIESGWFKFDASALKSNYDALYGAGNWTVTDASFNGYSFHTSTWQRAGNIDFAFNSDSSWQVGDGTAGSGITANNMPTGDSAITSWAYDNLGNPMWRTVGLGTGNADFVNAIMNGGAFSLHVSTSTTGGYLCWDSERYGPNETLRAYLNVSVAQTNVPEPGSMLALASGLVGFAGFAFRRRKS